MNGKELLPIIKHLLVQGVLEDPSALISNIHFVYIELWDATGHHPKGLVAVGCSLDGGDQGSLSFFLTQITDLNYWPLIRCMKLVLR